MAPGRALLVVATLAALALTLRSLLGSPVPLWLSLGALGRLRRGHHVGRPRSFARNVRRRRVARTRRGARCGAHFRRRAPPHVSPARCSMRSMRRGRAPRSSSSGRRARATRSCSAKSWRAGTSWACTVTATIGSCRCGRRLACAPISPAPSISSPRPPVSGRACTGPPSDKPTRASRASRRSSASPSWDGRCAGATVFAPTRRGSSQRVVPRLRDGAIVLLHDAAERDDHEPSAGVALPGILAAMRERGLEPVRLDAWIA